MAFRVRGAHWVRRMAWRCVMSPEWVKQKVTLVTGRPPITHSVDNGVQLLGKTVLQATQFLLIQ